MLIKALNLEQRRLISFCGSGGKTSLIFALAREFLGRGERVLITTTTKLGRQECEGAFPTFRAADAGDIIALADAGSPGSPAQIVYFEQGPNREKLVGFAPETIDEVFRANRFDRILVEADGSRRKPLKAPNHNEPVFPISSDAIVIVVGLNGIGKPLDDDTVFRSDIWAARTGLAPNAAITPASVARMIADPEGLARGGPLGAARSVFLNQGDNAQALDHARGIVEALSATPGVPPGQIATGWLLPAPGLASLPVHDRASTDTTLQDNNSSPSPD